MKIDDLEMRLQNLNQRATTDDESYRNKYMNTKRALEHLKEDFLKLENEMMEKREEVRLTLRAKTPGMMEFFLKISLFGQHNIDSNAGKCMLMLIPREGIFIPPENHA